MGVGGRYGEERYVGSGEVKKVVRWVLACRRWAGGMMMECITSHEG